jgi:hypothetical protein
MGKYLFSQLFRRVSIGIVLVGSMFIFVLLAWELFAKPKTSTIFLEDFSKISFPNDLKCDQMELTSTSVSDQFPLSLTYETNQIRLGIDTSTEHFDSQFAISNPKKIIMVFLDNQVDHRDTIKSVELPSSAVVNLSIKARWLNWDTPDVWSFDSIQEDIPANFLPIQTSCSGLNSNQCDTLQSNYTDSIAKIMNPTMTYEVGLCGQNLSYLPQYKSASLDDLYSIGARINPHSSDANGKSLFRLRFAYVSQITANGINITVPDNTDNIEVYILFEASRDSNFASPSINMVATQISDSLIRGHDPSTKAIPGLVYVYYVNTEKESVYGRTDLTPREIKLNSNTVTIESPKGSIITNSPKVDFKNDKQLVLTSTLFQPLKFALKQISDFNGRSYVIQGERISAFGNREYAPSPWDLIPRDIQVAYITAFFTILAGGYVYLFQKQTEIGAFFKWLIKIPPHRSLVILPNDANIFRLINGKKISGIIETIEGRSTYRIFVLKEVREWDKDNWGEVLPTEVRVPQNQIEMYYKARP